MEFFQIVLTPFSWLLKFFHSFSNYGVALILFAIVVKAILFPFSLKGKRSMIQQTMLQGQVQKIQQQYAKNREKMNEEVQKLYAKEGVNPMGGCLWSFVPLLILWPLYAIIRRPFYYMMAQTKDAIYAIAQALHFTPSTGELTASTVSSGYNELKLAAEMTQANLSVAQQAADGVSAGLGDKLFPIDFHFLGLDLSSTPQLKFWENGLTWASIGLFLLPLISAGLGLLMSLVSQKTNNMNNQNQQGNKQMRTMLIVSPLISLWIGFVMPAGLCVYWIINNILSIVQEFLCGKLLKKDYERAAAARAEQERLEKEEEKRRKQQAAERRARAIEEAKNSKGKKKPAAAEEKKKTYTNDAGRIGMRPYARGRSYDPDRYGGVTPYQDPGAPIDEEAVEAALAVKRALQEEAEAAARGTEEALEAAEPEEALEAGGAGEDPAAEETPAQAPEESPEEAPGESSEGDFEAEEESSDEEE